MNVIVMLVVAAERQAYLRTFAQGAPNTLNTIQTGHHITVAFKPDPVTHTQVCSKFEGARWFAPRQVLARPEIVAVFGDVLDGEGHILAAGVHITLAGTVPPAASKTLPEDHTTAWEPADHGLIPVELMEQVLGGATPTFRPVGVEV